VSYWYLAGFFVFFLVVKVTVKCIRKGIWHDWIRMGRSEKKGRNISCSPHPHEGNGRLYIWVVKL
jgi:hypothetical protein